MMELDVVVFSVTAFKRDGSRCFLVTALMCDGSGGFFVNRVHE